MNVIAVCQADLETTPLGTRSRLADELDGVPILRLTVERLLAVQGVETVFVLVPSDQIDGCKKLLNGCDVEVRGHHVEPAPWARLVRAARKWSLDGWRGGLGGTCNFDEYVDCRMLDGLLAVVEAEAVLAFPPAAPLFDPTLADGMIQLLHEADEEVRLTFAQAPPGVTGLVLRADLIKDLVEENAPIGWAFGYLPDSPQRDLIFQSCCYSIPAELRYASARLVADTDRSIGTITALLRECEPSAGAPPPSSAAGAPPPLGVGDGLVRRKPLADSIGAPALEGPGHPTKQQPEPRASARAETENAEGRVLAPDEMGRWLLRRDAEHVPTMPREVEIELTTDDPYPNSLLRPRGPRITARGPIDPELVQRVVSEIAVYDDALVVLGGFGDPLRHPEFMRILELIRQIHKPQALACAKNHPEPQASACAKPSNLRMSDTPSGGADSSRTNVSRGLKPAAQVEALACAEHPATSSSPGPFGLAVSTTAANLTDDHIEAMVRHGVDVLHVWLDAWGPDLYGQLHCPDDPASASLENVRRRLESVTEICRRHESPTPIVLPAMVKARDNVHELDDFHDGWIRRVGAVHIAGYSHHGRQCEDRTVISMAPPQRIACRRVSTRCLILADGRVAACDQDLNAQHVVGSLHEQSLEEIWNGPKFRRLRESHRTGRFNASPLCAACDEWHRP